MYIPLEEDSQWYIYSLETNVRTGRGWPNLIMGRWKRMEVYTDCT